MLEVQAVPILLPIGREAGFKGVVDLIGQKAYVAAAGGGKLEAVPIPDDLQDEVEALRGDLLNFAAESDDALIEKFLEEGELTPEDILPGTPDGHPERQLCAGFVRGEPKQRQRRAPAGRHQFISPRPGRPGPDQGDASQHESRSGFCGRPGRPPGGAGLQDRGRPLCRPACPIFRIYSGAMAADSTVTNATRAVPERFGQLFMLEGKGQKAVPSLGPGAFGAVAKLKDTVTGDTLTAEGKPLLLPAIPSSRPMVTFALEPKKQGEEDKVFSSFSKLIEEDPSLSLTRNAETKEILLSGVGSVHIEATAEKLKRKFGVEVNLKPPKVPYRETIKGTVKVQGKHKRQSGGRGQYGDTWLELEPLPKGSGFEFVDRIVGGAIPKQYIPSVEKGIAEAKNTGVLAGFPVVDFRVSLYDGSFHDVDSSDMAFKIAGIQGLQEGLRAG